MATKPGQPLCKCLQRLWICDVSGSRFAAVFLQVSIGRQHCSLLISLTVSVVAVGIRGFSTSFPTSTVQQQFIRFSGNTPRQQVALSDSLQHCGDVPPSTDQRAASKRFTKASTCKGCYLFHLRVLCWICVLGFIIQNIHLDPQWDYIGPLIGKSPMPCSPFTFLLLFFWTISGPFGSRALFSAALKNVLYLIWIRTPWPWAQNVPTFISESLTMITYFLFVAFCWSDVQVFSSVSVRLDGHWRGERCPIHLHYVLQVKGFCTSEVSIDGACRDFAHAVFQGQTGGHPLLWDWQNQPSPQMSVSVQNGLRSKILPSHRRLWPLHQKGGGVELVPELRGRAQPHQLRVPHNDPGDVPLQARPSALAHEKPHRGGADQGQHPLERGW